MALVGLCDRLCNPLPDEREEVQRRMRKPSYQITRQVMVKFGISVHQLCVVLLFLCLYCFLPSSNILRSSYLVFATCLFIFILMMFLFLVPSACRNVQVNSYFILPLILMLTLAMVFIFSYMADKCATLASRNICIFSQFSSQFDIDYCFVPLF